MDQEHEGELGKTECYIIDAEEGAEIIYGHKHKTKEELALKWRTKTKDLSAL